MTYTHKNSKGTWFLHGRGSLHWFARKIKQSVALDEVPEGYEVRENPKTKMPYLKKISS